MKAIIDLGTNTFHLLIAEIRNEQISEVFNLQAPVKLGEGGIGNDTLSNDAMQRGLTALGQFKTYLDRFEVQQVTALATSAIRNAKNGKEFVEKAKNLHGISIETITGDQEANYIYEGVRHSFKLPEENVLIMDIGGGSVEFIIGNKDNIKWKKSFDIGAARLIEKFKHSDPISDDEIAKLNNYFDEHLDELKLALKEFPVTTLVGSAGSFETLVDVVLNDLHTIPIAFSKQAFEINLPLFDIFYELMITSSNEQRGKLKGMVNFRLEMIVVASVLMRYVIDHFCIRKLIASNYALKEGVIFSK
jgi:exopolyphosphatase/guanosine-5'-triphosphate,3'-diphosphate pyrophosphatase